MFRAHRAHHQERQIVSIQTLVAVVAVSCAGRKFTSDLHTTRPPQLPDIVLTQFVSPDDEHDVLETCTELRKYK